MGRKMTNSQATAAARTIGMMTYSWLFAKAHGHANEEHIARIRLDACVIGMSLAFRPDDIRHIMRQAEQAERALLISIGANL